MVVGIECPQDFHLMRRRIVYQVEGNIKVTIRNGKAVEIDREGGCSCSRTCPASAIATCWNSRTVIECKHEDNMQDGLQWYYEIATTNFMNGSFTLLILKRIFTRFREFYSSTELRTCKKCGTIMEADPRFI
jgi:3-hydroxyanthranilate 3,4-dioxygenase